MPLPERRKGESTEDFVARCMSDETMKREFPDQQQRLAVCHRQAKAGAVVHFTTAAGDLRIEAAEGNQTAEGQRLPRFKMVAYTGQPMQLAFWRWPVIVDLAGLKIPSQTRPVRFAHDPLIGIGHTDSIRIEDGRLVATGVISRDTPAAKEVLASAKNGFPWQASIGASVEEYEFVNEKQKVIVNGHEYHGPLNVVRKAVLGEISFVDLAADPDTTVSVAAASKEFKLMDNATNPTDSNQKTIGAGNTTDTAVAPPAADVTAAAVTDQPRPSAAEMAKTIRLELAAEVKRIAAIRKLCAGKHPEIEIKAIEEGWDEQRAELEVLRASRAHAPAIHANPPAITAEAIEAALCMTARIAEDKLAKWYDAKTLEQANSRHLRGMGLSELFHMVIRAAGLYARPGRLTEEAVRTAFEADRMLRASAVGFSSLSLPGILSNVANKALLESYLAVEAVGPQICAQTDVNDFKQASRYRLTGVGLFEKVGPDGELKHARLSEQAYTNQVETYGTIISLTRQMIINDDLGAFLQIPRILGRQSALAVESAVFTLLLSNPNSFFSSTNKNLSTGADSALSIGGITKAEQLFLDQVDQDGRPILLAPKLLLVPTSLKVTAELLMKETRVNETTTANKPSPAANPHAGKFKVLCSPYLNAQGLTGSSSTAWYLFADPADVAAMEIAYLRGQRTPTIESGESDFDTLGMKWRGYFDFGVAMQDHRAAVRSTGT